MDGDQSSATKAPLDNLTYDLVTILHEESKGFDANARTSTMRSRSRGEGARPERNIKPSTGYAS